MTDRALNAAFEKASGQAEAIAGGIEASLGPCRLCKWARNLDPLCSFEHDYVCAHPFVSDMRLDPTTNDIDRSWVTQQNARQPGALCGPQGRLFDRRALWARWEFWIAIPLLLLAFLICWSCT